MWAIQKEIKDAYPKKVCHMLARTCYKKREKKREDAYPKKICHTPTRHVKKREKKYDRTHPRKIKEKGWFMKRSSYTIHKKYIYLYHHILAHLDQGL